MVSKQEIKQREDSKMAVAQSPAGPIEPVVNLKRRQRQTYWRPIVVKGNTIWQETLLLPSDAVNKEAYLSKGFRLSPPKTGAELEADKESKEALLAEIGRQDAEIKQLKAEQKNKGSLE